MEPGDIYTQCFFQNAQTSDFISSMVEERCICSRLVSLWGLRHETSCKHPGVGKGSERPGSPSMAVPKNPVWGGSQQHLWGLNIGRYTQAKPETGIIRRPILSVHSFAGLGVTIWHRVSNGNIIVEPTNRMTCPFLAFRWKADLSHHANVIRHPEAGAINCAPLFATPGYDNDILLSLRTVSTSVLQQESVNLCGAAFLYRKEDPPTVGYSNRMTKAKRRSKTKLLYGIEPILVCSTSYATFSGVVQLGYVLPLQLARSFDPFLLRGHQQLRPESRKCLALGNGCEKETDMDNFLVTHIAMRLLFFSCKYYGIEERPAVSSSFKDVKFDAPVLDSLSIGQTFTLEICKSLFAWMLICARAIVRGLHDTERKYGRGAA
ncbi:hypothetical protein F5J12DRAFT_929225 [Pisolithus orientalis]|uniref:uncharacterized protein n=1 Tax=Pisolithus orientalis TaxID=936130 RepID=UPI002223EF52|nr:uncharacterized protein F5J12DRAFT_929225 [Pisolithus orientalis]KAI5996006.1 hypothetical protein F5J12DRAFT_929225 [Pisolithus orientalis]